MKDLKESYVETTEIVKRIKPNIFVYDHVITTNTGIDQNIPYASILSAALTYLRLEELPPQAV